MNTKQLLKKIKLSDADFDEIKAAVQKAEAGTTGEIALAMTAESEHYSFWELLAATYLAGFAFILMLPLAGRISSLYESFLWEPQDWLLPAIYGAACLTTIIIGFQIANIPAVDRLIIPRAVRRQSVTDRAFRHFTESGVYRTAEHSGILIFVSFLERQVRIVADAGIAAKIPQDLWNIIADDLADGIKTGSAKEGFVSAIEKCGELLAEQFPARSENPNELSDGLAILEA